MDDQRDYEEELAEEQELIDCEYDGTPIVKSYDDYHSYSDVLR